MRALKPNEPPKQEAPDGCEWVQCTGKDGKPGWFAVVRAKAAVLRAAAKRKADEVPAGQPASKQGGRGKAAADDELVAGGGPLSMNVMDEDAVEAEEAAAKATIVVEAGNVQVGAAGLRKRGCGARRGDSQGRYCIARDVRCAHSFALFACPC
jgi:hypothetical protein